MFLATDVAFDDPQSFAADPAQILPGMRVVGPEGGSVAIIDQVRGASTIEVSCDDCHHVIPLGWITDVTGGIVRLDRPLSEARRRWSVEAPMGPEVRSRG
jgi:hypothetical protein